MNQQPDTVLISGRKTSGNHLIDSFFFLTLLKENFLVTIDKYFDVIR